MNIGQYLDILGTARGDTDHAGARRIASYKSGKYTVERPLHLGAALAGQLSALAEPLSAYGLPLGEAFQMRDDLLGAFGEELLVGKPVGDDLREGKPTPLYALYQARDGFSEFMVTVIYAAYAIGVIGALALAGHLSDWYGRRRMGWRWRVERRRWPSCCFIRWYS